MFRLIQEAVIDIPRRTYAKGVFDDADTDNPKLKQGVLDIINNQIKQKILVIDNRIAKI